MLPAHPDGGAAAPLRGRHIVVTRPASQSARLAGLIAAAGGHPIVFPLIEIRAAADPAARERIARIGDYDFAVFVSANAVEHGLALLSPGAALPSALCVAAVGKGTARALRDRGVSRVVVPSQRFDSEGLLALPELADVAGRRVLVVRGVGGRETLADTLAGRGARVEYAECYERRRPTANIEVLLAAWRRNALDAITITSSESLRNLATLLPDEARRYLHATPFFVTHERMRETARALGIDDVMVASTGDDEGLHAALVHYYSPGA